MERYTDEAAAIVAATFDPRFIPTTTPESLRDRIAAALRQAAQDDERHATTAILLAMSGVVPTPAEGYRSFDHALDDLRMRLEQLRAAATDAAAAEREECARVAECGNSPVMRRLSEDAASMSAVIAERIRARSQP